MTETRPRRAALFVDFDNVYGGLRTIDPALAERFATDPATWLDAVASGDGLERRFLVRKCYLNPSAHSRYRPYWTRAGFRVIDCPSLTQQGKSSADINLVLDAIDVLGAETRVDEFVIASADADFTSLVQRFRAADRWTTVVVAGPVASAYRSVADQVVQADDLLELVAGGSDRANSSGAASQETATATAAGRDAVIQMLRGADGPVDLASLAHRARTADPALTRDWGEHGSFRAWLEASGDEVGIYSAGTPGYAWDATRFSTDDVPQHRASDTARDDLLGGDELIEQIVTVTDVPRLSAAAYRATLEAIAGDTTEHGFDLNTTSKRVRDTLATTPDPVGRGPISFVLRGVQYAGVDLRAAPGLASIADAWVRNVQSLVHGARVELDDSERSRVRAWAGGGLVE